MSTAEIAETYEDASRLFAALSSPVRIAIVALLSAEERCVHELVDALDLPQPLVSQHLRVLRGAQLVTGRRRGREVAYALSDDHVGHIVRDALQHSTESRSDEPSRVTRPRDRPPSGAKQ